MNFRLILVLPILFTFVSVQAQQTAEEWYAKGVEATAQTQKITYFTKAIQLNPKAIEFYNARANVHFVMGQVPEAIQDFSQSIRLDSSRLFTFYSRASCYLAQGNYAAAADDFDQVIKLEPNHVYAISGKGCALLLQDKPEEAIQVLDQALVLDETVQSAVRCRENALKKLGKQPLAAKSATKPSFATNKNVENTPPPTPAVQESSVKFRLKEATSLRESATHTSRTLLRFSVGNEVELLEKTDELWWKVLYKGKIGYAKAALLEVVN